MFCLRRCDGGHHRCRSAVRGRRLHPRLPGRADDARRQDHPDLRGHQSDSACGDVAGVVALAADRGQRPTKADPGRIRSSTTTKLTLSIAIRVATATRRVCVGEPALDLRCAPARPMPVLSQVTPAPNWQSLSLLLVEDDRADILRSYKLRANAYVTKPVDLDQFMVRQIDEFFLQVVKLPGV